MSRPLDPTELARKLDEVLKTPKSKYRERRLVALEGHCDSPSVDTTQVGPVRIVAVRSELELRRRLPGVHEEPPYTAYVLGWPIRELPVDIAGRFARDGRVIRFTREDRIRALFGGASKFVEVDSDLGRSRLGAYLVEKLDAGSIASTGGRITLDAAFAAWLKGGYDLDAGEGLGLDTLLAWAAANGRGSKLADEMKTEAAAGVLDELGAFLRRRVGDAGPAVLDCWMRGRGRLLLQFTALFEVAVLDPEQAPRGSIVSAARLALGLDDATLETILLPLGRVADAAFRAAKADAGLEINSLLEEAEQQIAASERPKLIGSPRLPTAWRERLDRLGRALAAGAESPSVATFSQARDALRGLESHLAYLSDGSARTLARAQFATRLLGWLVVRPDRREHNSLQSYAAAESLALWYAQEGGYVDIARRRARGSGDSEFERGIACVLAATDAARVELDRRFARAFAEWLRANRPPGPLVPMDRAVSTFVAPYLQGEHRRCLLLMVDGMAWAQAVELLDSLAQGHQPWYPTAWNTMATATGNGFFAPALAQLPTITNVSRLAFFSGAPTKAGTNIGSAKHDKPWSQHKALQDKYPDGCMPRLLGKSDAFAIDGTASKAALSLIADQAQPVVALIVNAIDEHLKASTQEEHPWTVDRIHALRDLLDAAAQAGRAVLLASDHGHVSGQRLVGVGVAHGNEEGNTRWRPWIEGDAEREYEVAIEAGPHVWAPKGPKTKGVILLADDEHQYGSQHHYGEHGGATLAEVVTPLFMIGTESLKPKGVEKPDSALETRPAQPPSWWLLDVLEVQPVPAAEPKPRTKTRIREAEGQQVMGFVAPQAEPSPAATASPVHVSSHTRELLERLAKHKLFLARAPDPAKRKQTLLALELLLERNGTVSTAVFAKHVGQPVYRIGGFVANLTEILNVDGYEVVSHEPGPKQVVLNRELLEQQFDLRGTNSK